MYCPLTLTTEIAKLIDRANKSWMTETEAEAACPGYAETLLAQQSGISQMYAAEAVRLGRKLGLDIQEGAPVHGVALRDGVQKALQNCYYIEK